MSGVPRLGWSDFARERYRPGGDHSHFLGDERELLDLVGAHWAERRPGFGRDDLDEVVVVPVPPERFVCATVRIDEGTPLSAVFTHRQDHEDGYAEVRARGPREKARHAGVVLYSAAALELNDGRRSGDCDWEIVCVLASPVVDEPMDPLTMARNMLAKPGGTPCLYTAEQFAESVWYWSGRAKIEPEGS